MIEEKSKKEKKKGQYRKKERLNKIKIMLKIKTA